MFEDNVATTASRTRYTWFGCRAEFSFSLMVAWWKVAVVATVDVFSFFAMIAYSNVILTLILFLRNDLFSFFDDFLNFTDNGIFHVLLLEGFMICWTIYVYDRWLLYLLLLYYFDIQLLLLLFRNLTFKKISWRNTGAFDNIWIESLYLFSLRLLAYCLSIGILISIRSILKNCDSLRTFLVVLILDIDILLWRWKLNLQLVQICSCLWSTGYLFFVIS